MLKRWNRTTTCRALFAAGVAVSIANTAYAQEESLERHHPRPNQFMKDADQDGDRQLSFEEASNAMPNMTAERFERMDQNGDGQLTPNEIHRARARSGDRDSDRRGERGRGFEHVDSNGDGQVSFEELTAVRPNISHERFDGLDKDGDGFLSHEELRRGHRRGGEGRHGDPARHFEKADVNGDGELSFEEFSANAEEMRMRMFNRMDVNGDGVVTREEMSRHRPPHHRRQRDGRRHGSPEEGENGSDSKDRP